MHSFLLSRQKLCILKYCFLPLAKGKEACLTRRVEYTVVAHMSSIVSQPPALKGPARPRPALPLSGPSRPVQAPTCSSRAAAAA